MIRDSNNLFAVINVLISLILYFVVMDTCIYFGILKIKHLTKDVEIAKDSQVTRRKIQHPDWLEKRRYLI